MSWRRPPGFMNAICEDPSVADSVAHCWTSATRLPSVDSPAASIAAEADASAC